MAFKQLSIKKLLIYRTGLSALPVMVVKQGTCIQHYDEYVEGHLALYQFDFLIMTPDLQPRVSAAIWAKFSNPIFSAS